jgi:hypothetical protein
MNTALQCNLVPAREESPPPSPEDAKGSPEVVVAEDVGQQGVSLPTADAEATDAPHAVGVSKSKETSPGAPSMPLKETPCIDDPPALCGKASEAKPVKDIQECSMDGLETTSVSGERSLQCVLERC